MNFCWKYCQYRLFLICYILNHRKLAVGCSKCQRIYSLAAGEREPAETPFVNNGIRRRFALMKASAPLRPISETLMTNFEKSQLILFVCTVPNAVLISINYTVVVRARSCVVSVFFFVVKRLMWGLLATVEAFKAWTILPLPLPLPLPTTLVSVTDPG
ncbi:hypothetical protein FIU95_05060 [Microbulbifer sp. THAF38]|nr:hypothetical protein FIU95_05060 [Microbulbifer sp. THAF38]